ncbi:MAG: radical SAM protein [Candidatus Omnitrophica bacterium]|nr:radical SAM protein [Candidatus Omnitrophota bacterium]
MSMLNPTQFDNDTFLRKFMLFHRRSQGKLFAYLRNRLYWHYLCKLGIKPKFPPHLDIEPTPFCNMKCPMCFQQHMDIPKDGYMDFNLYKKVVDECAANNLYSIRLCHRGEPLIHEKIVEMVRYAKQKGIKEVFTLTNGLKLDEKMIKDLMDAGIDWIQVSIDGMGDYYNKIRYPQTFDQVFEKIKMMHRIREERKALRPIIWIQSIWSSVKHNPQEFIDKFKPYVDKIAFHVDFDYEHRFKPDPNFICYRLWHRMMIMADGSVPMCNSDFLKEELVGNVKTQSVKEIWNNAKYEKIRQIHRAKRRFEIPLCKKCNWGNLKETRVIDVNGKKETIQVNVPQDAYKEELKDITL